MAFLEEYTLLDELGQGGFATVYKVRHNKLGYIRAIRVLNAIIAHGESDKAYQKFLEECRLLLRLGNGNHPNIVHVYQPLLKAQRAIVEMDYVDGKDLYHYLEANSSFVGTEDVIKLLTDISSALAYCHEDIYKFCMDKEEDNLKDDPNDGSKVLLDLKTQNFLIEKYRVIHNDIHSRNIIRRENGLYVLLDFGLAIEGDSVVRSSRRKNGAPEFKAPEKWENDSILTTQSDIYSFGVVLYEFLSGRVPFQFDKKNSNTVEAEYLLGQAHKEQTPEPIYGLRKVSFEKSHPGEVYEKDYPEWLEELIMKCLSKDPKNRFKNGKELYDYAQKYTSADSRLSLELKKENLELQNQIAAFKEAATALKRKNDELVSDLQGRLKDAISCRSLVENDMNQLRIENKNLKEKLDSLSVSPNSSQEQAQQTEDLEKELSASTSQLDAIACELSRANEIIDSLKDENQKLKFQRKTNGNNLWKIITIIVFFSLSAIISYFIYNEVVDNDNTKMSMQEKIEDVIGLYYKNIIENKYSELSSMYAENVQRYYSENNVTPMQIIEDIKSNDQRLGIVSKEIYVDWNTLEISNNNNAINLSYNIVYIIETSNDAKSSIYELKMHLVLDQCYKICSIYEEVIGKSDAAVTENRKEENSLRSQKQDKSTLINDLTSQVQTLTREISRLKSSMNNNQSIIAERDKTIEQLHTRINSLNAEIKEKNTEISALRKQLFKN